MKTKELFEDYKKYIEKSEYFNFGEHKNGKVVQFNIKPQYWLQFVPHDNKPMLQICTKEKLPDDLNFEYADYWGFYYKNLIDMSDRDFNNDLEKEILNNQIFKKVKNYFNNKEY
ncbi:MAG: hypothetical protein ACI37S_05700 [Candidatus Gastranaerophilaceae bacterium]